MCSLWLQLLLWCLPALSQTPQLTTWRLEASGIHGETDVPLSVGSIQKPFVAKAWAMAHSGAPSPRFQCEGGAACWLRPGHGELGLSRALALSCNSYFRRLASETPREVLDGVFREAGFLGGPKDAEEALGLGGPGIRPSRLLESMRRLLRDPWPQGEPLRAEVRRGLRESSALGTAGAAGPLGRWVKTGTVPLPADPARHTEGFALAVGEEGGAMLVRLSPGTGAQAAVALGGASPAVTPREGWVRVRMFDLVKVRTCEVVNLGSSPVPAGPGFLGPGATLKLAAGGQVGPGLLEIRLEPSGLRRRLQGELHRAVDGALVARVELRAYVAGVLAGECPPDRPDLTLPLGAAILRFLGQGPRHPAAEVCDSTHCAWFLGLGPRMDWRDPARAIVLEGTATVPLDEGVWKSIQAEAVRPGPGYWTGHCGGHPLAPSQVWGGVPGDPQPCPRHREGEHPWERSWSRKEAERAFGPGITAMEVATVSGQWMLRLRRQDRVEHHPYDQAHRCLATVLGWSALPSPADRVEETPEGWRAEGTGLGHRVGLCLGE